MQCVKTEFSFGKHKEMWKKLKNTWIDEKKKDVISSIIFLDTETTGIPIMEGYNKYYDPKELKYYKNSRIIELGYVITKEETKLPKPTGWRMLVLPFRMDEKTKGGILLGGETIDRQQVASQCGNVLAMGDACYVDKERYPNGPWCKVGDWVVFARYAGSRIEIDGGEVRLLNEDEVLATVEDPTDILHKY